MRTHEFQPDLKDENGQLFFEGKIVVKKPNWKERQELRKKLIALPDGQSESFMMDLAAESFVSMELTINGSDEKITEFDDLMDYQEGMIIAMKMSEIQTTGIALGKGLQHYLANK